MRKPEIKSVWKGVKGNKWKAYDVIVDGKKYHHQNKANAVYQFESAKKVYARLNKRPRR